MKTLALIAGAVSCALLAGAATGNAISTEPLGQTASVSDILPERRTVEYPARLARTKPARDQYPLVTPDGTIEVSELIWHGRYRDRVRYPAPIPGDDDLYRYEPIHPDTVQLETSSAAAALDAQQPEPATDPVIASVDRQQRNFAMRYDRVAASAQSEPVGKPESTDPVAPQMEPASITPAAVGQNTVVVRTGTSVSTPTAAAPTPDGVASGS